MHPYAQEVMARLHAEELHREAARYRLVRLAKTGAGRRKWRTFLTARPPNRGLVERPCVDC